LQLLRRPDFRRLYLAVAASELGDSLHYIALMWFALDAGGPLGVVAVRLADSIPALVFGLHGGIAADRWSRKRLMVSADVARGIVLAPVAAAGLAGALPLWGLVVAAAALETATSYFAPAYGATVPSLVERENVQRANALVQATAQALSIGGWAVAAAFLTFMPVSVFFAVNAASFLVSGALISRLRHGEERDRMRPRRAPARALLPSGRITCSQAPSSASASPSRSPQAPGSAECRHSFATRCITARAAFRS
jgi:MFS transporter, DHA3 family, macrolide efflux protein